MRVVFAAASALGLGLIGCGGKSKPKPTPAPTPAPVIYEPETVRAAWENHFQAFGSADVEKIAQDYDDTSVISVYNDECVNNESNDQFNDSYVGYEEYVGVTAIKIFFTQLFIKLEKNGTKLELGLPLFTPETNPLVTEFPGASVFLVWNTTDASVFPFATDTFFWKARSAIPKIMKQNIVITSPSAECITTKKPAAPAKGVITMAWENHFSAFGEQNTTKILADYTNESVINVWDNTKTTFTSHKGLGGVGKFFDDLWGELKAASTNEGLGLKVLVQEVEPDEKSVFLVWQSFSHPKATDSFYFDETGKIVVQNIVVATKKQTSNVAIAMV